MKDTPTPPPDLEQNLRQRLDQLRAEYQAGEQQRAALTARLEELNATMLRISGAIQVLEEALPDDQPVTE